MYRKKGRSWTKHIDFMLLDVLCMQIAFIVSYICRFGLNNPYIDKDYRILAVAFLLIDFFVEIVSDAFKNVLKRGYLDEFIVTCKHVALVEIITTFFLFTTQMGEIYSRMSYYIMIPIYILVSYLGRMVLKKIIKKRGFASSKESLFVIAPEKLLRETLQGLKENGFGYTQIVAAATDADLNGKTIWYNQRHIGIYPPQFLIPEILRNHQHLCRQHHGQQHGNYQNSFTFKLTSRKSISYYGR